MAGGEGLRREDGLVESLKENEMEDWKGPIFRQPTCLPGQLERLEKGR